MFNSHFAVHLKLTQSYKLTLIKKNLREKEKKISRKNLGENPQDLDSGRVLRCDIKNMIDKRKIQ